MAHKLNEQYKTTAVGLKIGLMALIGPFSKAFICICVWKMSDCIVGLKLRLIAFIFPFLLIFLSFPFCILILKICVTISQELLTIELLTIESLNQTTKCLRNQGRTKGEGWWTAN